MAHADVAKVVENIATTLTNQIQSTENVNLTKFSGHALITGIFVRVRWLWLLLPVLTMFATCVLLVISIIVTKQ
jgi:hypothetical protein